MDIKFIGTGGAFNVAYGNSAALVKVGQDCILLDCGHAVFPRLVAADKAREVDAVLITHFHDDHVGSLSSLILYHQLVLGKGKIKLIYPNEQFKSLLVDFLTFSLGQPENRVDFVPLSDYPMIGAIDTFGLHVREMPTWAYYFVEKDAAIFYSGDLGQPEKFFQGIQKLDLSTPAIVFHEMSFHEGNAHTYYKDLEPYLADHTIYAYHLDPTLNPEDNRVPLVYDQAHFML